MNTWRDCMTDAGALTDALRNAVAHFNNLPLHDHAGRATAHREIVELREQIHAAGGKPKELAYAA